MKYQKRSLIYLSVLLLIVFVGWSQGEPALKDVFADDFVIGAALNTGQILGRRSDEIALVAKHFNTITPENILKWGMIHPERERYNFASGDVYVDFGEKNNMFIVGHTLIWHNQTPDWVFQDADGTPVSRDILLDRMKSHIFAVAGRYNGRIDAWDVVNEAIDSDGTLRKTKWLDIIGDDFIEKAFEFAHQVDPDAELYYNDYDMCNKKHQAGVIALIKALKAKGLRIDGIGIQGHWSLDSPKADDIETAILAFSQLGVKVMITELDITVLPSAWSDRGADITKSYGLQEKLNPYTNGLPEEVQQKLSARYAELFVLFRKHADKISRVTFWGVQDGNSWLNNWPVKGRTDYPLLFDRNCDPKPAFKSVVEGNEGD